MCFVLTRRGIGLVGLHCNKFRIQSSCKDLANQILQSSRAELDFIVLYCAVVLYQSRVVSLEGTFGSLGAENSESVIVNSRVTAASGVSSALPARYRRIAPVARPPGNTLQ